MHLTLSGIAQLSFNEAIFLHWASQLRAVAPGIEAAGS